MGIESDGNDFQLLTLHSLRLLRTSDSPNDAAGVGR